ncbi:DUF2622 domain-containing protein [Proteus terrae]|uniref:DUF2622 domain-containing protein n=1 Tax=Proteus terrae TaxID=1574161 RepID=UPI0013E008F1|nr:DUF2622 domain-containing protein [Proteus terrae]QIF97645.1 DUF2622 domain-containing protein [Proteus terrae subsp. cibarius]
MANFIVRIELYNADYDDYESLHQKMEGIRFYRKIKYPNGKEYDLPNGTYFGVSSQTASQLLESITRISKPLSKLKGPSIFIGAFGDWASSLYPSK